MHSIRFTCSAVTRMETESICEPSINWKPLRMHHRSHQYQSEATAYKTGGRILAYYSYLRDMLQIEVVAWEVVVYTRTTNVAKHYESTLHAAVARAGKEKAAYPPGEYRMLPACSSSHVRGGEGYYDMDMDLHGVFWSLAGFEKGVSVWRRHRDDQA